MFTTSQELQRRFSTEKYLCSEETATVIYLAIQLQKPLLIEGPAGVGKTELAKVLSATQNIPLIRLQCYEGLDESKALYEWEYGKQLLYTQILKDKIAETLKNCQSVSAAVDSIADEDHAFFSERFLVPRPLLRSISSDQTTVLLIDEVDKSDPEFEAFLLEILSDFQVSIPEIGTINARHIPQVILTSNNSRELSDALKRRCLYLYLDFPSRQQEAEILKSKIPELEESLIGKVVFAVETIRRLSLKKQPSIGETLDWAKTLLLLNAHELDPKVFQNSLPALIKYPDDQKRVLNQIDKILSTKHINGPSDIIQ